ncbi:MAG: calcineurin [Polyangiaceae bacterium]|nr:calcineurin [Polyangiaceae bacterium]
MTLTRLAFVAAVLFGCGQGSSSSPTGSQPASSQAVQQVAVTANVHAAPKRIVAFGDVHGDLDATKRALKLGRIIDDNGAWIAGDTFVVQVGDQLDRGDDDRAILDLFDSLEEKAKAAGGTFLALNGNHEIMNAQLDFRYATEGGNSAFNDITSDKRAVRSQPEQTRGRAAAFIPGGPYAQKLAKRPIYAIVGDSVFVHGGITMKHVQYGLEKMDTETKEWLEGKRNAPPSVLVAEDGPVWTRAFSAQTGPDDCKELDGVLAALGKKRMVMGHTPQKPDISFACDNKAIRIDVGMSRHYGGTVQVLEIVGDEVKALKE